MPTNSFDFTNNLSPHPILHCAAVVDKGAAVLPGDESETRSTIAFSHNTHTVTTNLDETNHLLRKGIVDNLIKNPRTFQGGKDNVK